MRTLVFLLFLVSVFAFSISVPLVWTYGSYGYVPSYGYGYAYDYSYPAPYAPYAGYSSYIAPWYYKR